MNKNNVNKSKKDQQLGKLYMSENIHANYSENLLYLFM